MSIHRTTVASLITAFVLAIAAPARADLAMAVDPPAPVVHEHEDSAATTGLAIALGGFAAADLGFGISDAVHASRGTVAARGVSYAEMVVAGPQSAAFMFLESMLVANGRDDEGDTAALVVLPAFTNALFVHGAMSASLHPGTSQATLYGVPWAVGFDTALTFPAIVEAAQGRLDPRMLGIVEMVATAPQVAAFSYAIARDPRSPAWIGMTAWSSGLFVHGLFSTVTTHEDNAPPSPPSSPKHPLLVPDSVELAPGTVRGGAMLTVRGKLY